MGFWSAFILVNIAGIWWATGIERLASALPTEFCIEDDDDGVARLKLVRFEKKDATSEEKP